MNDGRAMVVPLDIVPSSPAEQVQTITPSAPSFTYIIGGHAHADVPRCTAERRFAKYIIIKSLHLPLRITRLNKVFNTLLLHGYLRLASIFSMNNL